MTRGKRMTSGRRAAIARLTTLALCGITTPAFAVVALHSRGDLRPPAIVVDRNAGNVAPGLIFLAPKKVFGAKRAPGEQSGPMIADDRGHVLWFRPMPKGQSAYDFRVQQYRGKPVLTWWQGRAVKGSGRGEGMILDSSYRLIKRVRGAHGYRPDIHEFALTKRGTALVTVYRTVTRDLSSVGGPRRGRVVEGIVQEIDVATGRLRLEWHSLGHVSLKESYEPLPSNPRQAWDYFHINSIDVDADGNLLVSARHTWAVYKLGRRSGRIIWRLGGKRSDFALGRGVHFAWQHDARAQGKNVLRIFDNAAATKPVRAHSRIITISLHPRTRRAQLVRSIVHPKGLSSGTQGNASLLANGDTFVGWGSQRYFSEFDRRGRLIFDGHLPRGYDSYRAYRSPWVGTPNSRPSLAATADGLGHVTAYASWNGATEVATWQVLAGATPAAMAPVGSPSPPGGLETAITVATPDPYVAVAARDSAGTLLRTSPAVMAIRAPSPRAAWPTRRPSRG
jgi:hypothetical protein